MPKNLYRHEQFEAPKPEPPSTPLRTLPEPRQPPSGSGSNFVNPSPTPQPPKTTPVQIPPQPARVTYTTSTNNTATPSAAAAAAIAEQKRKEEQVELSRKSLMEPIIPEDSFSYGKGNYINRQISIKVIILRRGR